jgi:hypothetical protein
MISFQTDSQHDTPSQIRRSGIEIIFLLDITNDKSEITVPNGRVSEVLSLPHQLQLKQTGPGENMACLPVDERGCDPESQQLCAAGEASGGAQAAQARQASWREGSGEKSCAKK